MHCSSVEAYLLWKCCCYCFKYVFSFPSNMMPNRLYGIFYLYLKLWQEICVINAQSSYSNKTAVIVIISMRSLVSIEQQSSRRPCDIKQSIKEVSWALVLKILGYLADKLLREGNRFDFLRCTKGGLWTLYFPTHREIMCNISMQITRGVYPNMQWGCTPHRQTPPRQTPPGQTSPLRRQKWAVRIRRFRTSFESEESIARQWRDPLQLWNKGQASPDVQTRMHSSRMRTTRSSSRRGVWSDPPQFPPWLWAWIWSPSISPLAMGLDLNPLNSPPVVGLVIWGSPPQEQTPQDHAFPHE